jgi:hypothetical protein
MTASVSPVNGSPKSADAPEVVFLDPRADDAPGVRLRALKLLEQFRRHVVVLVDAARLELNGQRAGAAVVSGTAQGVGIDRV